MYLICETYTKPYQEKRQKVTLKKLYKNDTTIAFVYKNNIKLQYDYV